MALDFEELITECTAMPTVQAGAVLALVRLRNELVGFVGTEDLEGITDLLNDLDGCTARLADAILETTPTAVAAHEARARRVQAGEEAD